jgi:hypothetical protein
MKYLLKIANVYQIIIWLISAIYYILGIVNSIWPNKDSVGLLTNGGVICLSIIIICSNIYFLIDSKNKSFYLKNLYFNKWINLIQILNISLVGFTFYAIIGIRIMGYYAYDESQKLAISYGFFRFKSEGSYVKSDIIFVGINLIPVILSLIFNRYIDEHRKKMVEI